jgi:acyl carrier protein
VPLQLRGLAASAAGSGAEVPALLRGLVRLPRRRTASATPDQPSGQTLAQRLSGRSRVEQENLLLDLVRRHAATVMGHGSPDAVQRDRGFLDLGMTSLTAVELRNRLAAETGIRLPTTLIFDYPTPAALARQLHTEMGLDAAAAPVPVFTELERLEMAVSGAELGHDERARLVKRLSALRWKVDSGGDEAATDATDLPELTAATDDEMFALIDKELGRG